MTTAPRYILVVLAVLFAAGLMGQPAAAASHGKTKARAAAPVPPIGGANATAPAVGIDTQATHAIIVEVETGAVLLDKNADERMPPASMSKMMTAYLVFSMLKDGKAKLTDELPVSEEAWRTGGSKMFVPLGGKITVSDLLRGMIVQSGNDACVVLAQGLAGSVDAFVDLMNEKAKQIGLKDSHFSNVDGLPDPNHWMTARDLATLAIRTIKDFPEYYKIYSEMEFAYNNINQGNRNPLLYKNMGADGLKTGHTEEAGYSLTGSMVRGGRRIVIVLGGLPTMKARAEESERLADWAFREFNDYRLFAAGDKVEDAQVWLGTDARVPLTVGKDLVVTLSRKARKEMQVSVQYDSPVPAPVKKGEDLGKIVISAPDMQQQEMPLVALADVGRMDAMGRIATLAGYLVWGDRH
ncbi:MAG TPA: D-alanyl-D-alanine carboxypeptidase family protein [Stellaceae bacterium]|jgi:serine-type D-Ala-D-Ala carboxypeptidase (penicillin-binding protein 5/6)|nr:D-alanyl-D-alanine carboxypeptidase family protein [Stellaceae bacterium]